MGSAGVSPAAPALHLPRLDLKPARREISHMTTLVKADDKGRIPIRGTEEGRQYRVTKANGGWWVMPAQGVRPPKKRREWAGPTKDLSQHLQEMADLGFTFEPSEISKQKVGPCRF